MILMSKVFQRLLNSFDAILGRETSTDPLRDPLHSRSRRSKYQDKCLFVCLLSAEILFLPMANDQTFPVFVSKVQNEQGILFVKMTYTGRPHPKGAPFSDVKYMRGWDFTC